MKQRGESQAYTLAMDVGPLYHPPQANLDAAILPEGVPWRIEGRTLYARIGVRLPDICIFTGEATGSHQRVETSLSWTPRWFAIAWIVATVPALLAYSFFRRTGRIDYGLGDVARKRRRLVLLIQLAVVASFLGLLIVPAVVADPVNIVFILLLVIIVSWVVAWRLRLFRLVKIDRKHIQLELTVPAAQAFARLSADRPA